MTVTVYCLACGSADLEERQIPEGDGGLANVGRAHRETVCRGCGALVAWLWPGVST